MPTPSVPQNWSREYMKGGAGVSAFPSTMSASAAIFPANWQIGAVFSQTQTVTLPTGLTGDRKTVTLSTPLNSFPNPIRIPSGAYAQILAWVNVGLLSDELATYWPLINLPYITISYGTGVAGSQNGAVGANAVLTGPIKVTAATMNVVLQTYYPVLLENTTTLGITFNAILFGQFNPTAAYAGGSQGPTGRSPNQKVFPHNNGNIPL